MTEDADDPQSLADAGLDCHRCGKNFKSHFFLRRHLIHVHGIAQLPGPTVEISRDAVDGRPICRHCGVAFISWQNFRPHISSLSCTSLELSKAPPVVLSQHRRRLLNIFDSGDLQLLKENEVLCNFLTNRCVLRGCWAARTQQMSAHMAREHVGASNLVHEVLPNTTRARVTSPCSYCKAEFQSKTHTCPVLKQVALALGDRRRRALHPDTPEPSPMVKMMKSTTEWHSTPPTERTVPLRIQVLRVLLEELLHRVQKLLAPVSDGPPRTPPPSISMFAMESHQEAIGDQSGPNSSSGQTMLTCMLALLQQHSLIVRFGALRPNQQIQQSLEKPSEARTGVIPWRLTLALCHPY